MNNKLNRKELKAQYKQSKPDAGVYRIINNKTGKYFMDSCLDTKGECNKFEFVKKTNSYTFMHGKLSNAIREQGFDNFSFEVLELLDIKPEMTDDEIKEDLKTLEEIWRDKLGTDDEY